MSYATSPSLMAVGDTIFPARKMKVSSFALAAAGATSTIELFDGLIGVVDEVADTSIGAAGTNYEVGDLITLASAGGTDLILEVATVDTGGEVLTYTISQVGTGLAVGNTQATTTNSVAGADFTIDIDAVDDTGAVSVGKISCVANTSDSQNPCAVIDEQLSVRVTGASAKGYVYHE